MLRALDGAAVRHARARRAPVGSRSSAITSARRPRRRRRAARAVAGSRRASARLRQAIACSRSASARLVAAQRPALGAETRAPRRGASRTPRRSWRSISPPLERGEALAVQLGRAEPEPVEHHALEPDLDVALPGEADPAVHLDGVARDLLRALGDVRLGERRRARRLGGSVVEGVRGVPPEAARRLDLESPCSRAGASPPGTARAAGRTAGASARTRRSRARAGAPRRRRRPRAARCPRRRGARASRARAALGRRAVEARASRAGGRGRAPASASTRTPRPASTSASAPPRQPTTKSSAPSRLGHELLATRARGRSRARRASPAAASARRPRRARRWRAPRPTRAAAATPLAAPGCRRARARASRARDRGTAPAPRRARAPRRRARARAARAPRRRTAPARRGPRRRSRPSPLQSAATPAGSPSKIARTGCGGHSFATKSRTVLLQQLLLVGEGEVHAPSSSRHVLAHDALHLGLAERRELLREIERLRDAFAVRPVGTEQDPLDADQVGERARGPPRGTASARVSPHRVERILVEVPGRLVRLLAQALHQQVQPVGAVLDARDAQPRMTVEHAVEDQARQRVVDRAVRHDQARRAGRDCGTARSCPSRPTRRRTRRSRCRRGGTRRGSTPRRVAPRPDRVARDRASARARSARAPARGGRAPCARRARAATRARRARPRGRRARASARRSAGRGARSPSPPRASG